MSQVPRRSEVYNINNTFATLEYLLAPLRELLKVLQVFTEVIEPKQVQKTN